MSGFVIGGKEVIPTRQDGSVIEVVNFLDDPRLKLTPGIDSRPRTTQWIHIICAHTTVCYRTVIVPGVGPNRNVELKVANWWRKDGRKAGAHATIDFDGSIGCHCDLMDAARHAGSLNNVSIGFEIAKLWSNPKGGVYQIQIDRAVELTDWLCRYFRIQKQCVCPTMNNVVIPRIARGGRGKRPVVGVVGHMHQTKHKPWDPGPQYFEGLVKAGFMPFTFSNNMGLYDDLEYWKRIQDKYRLSEDGVPGTMTTDALEDAGYEGGLWVPPEHPAGALIIPS